MGSLSTFRFGAFPICNFVQATRLWIRPFCFHIYRPWSHVLICVIILLFIIILVAAILINPGWHIRLQTSFNQSPSFLVENYDVLLDAQHFFIHCTVCHFPNKICLNKQLLGQFFRSPSELDSRLSLITLQVSTWHKNRHKKFNLHHFLRKKRVLVAWISHLVCRLLATKGKMELENYRKLVLSEVLLQIC